MPIQFTILTENCVAGSGLLGEHGLSVLIEIGNDAFLFDTGAGRALPHNLKSLHKNLTGIKKLFLSHGHYDHTGGLEWVLQHIGGVDVVAHPDLFCRHMVFDPRQSNPQPRYVGCPFAQEKLVQDGAIFQFVNQTREIAEGVWFVTEVERDDKWIPKDTRLMLDIQGQLVLDPIRDDSSLLITHKGASVLLLGCAHSGLLNILDHIEQKLDVRQLKAIIGGTHLMYTQSEGLQEVIDRIESFGTDIVATAHCTGFQAAVALAQHFKDRYVRAGAGCEIVI
jgi:7,8-dihydropterin-6-yl-methyl-4-(beta-D-ribofuranosyl)aminobenzene 5'-phosphate synthase